MYRMTEFFDSYGPMAKSPADLVGLLEIILGRRFQDKELSVSDNWDGLAVGFVDPNVWKLSPEMCRQKEGTLEQMVSPKPQSKRDWVMILTESRWVITKQGSPLSEEVVVQ